MRAHSSHSRGPARWAAALAFTGALTVLTALPAHAAGSDYTCDTGSYKPAIGLLGAFGCTGSGSTNVFVSVDTLVSPGNEGSGSFLCTDFGPSGVPGHWAGHCR